MMTDGYTLPSGMTLSRMQDILAVQYKDSRVGPDEVYRGHVSQMPRELLEDLVMANVAKRAYEFSNA